MRFTKCKRTAALLLVALVAGCVPAKFVEVPAIRGRVVDAEGVPVPNATVRVLKADATRVAEVVTGLDGTFHRAEQSRIALQFAGADGALRKYVVTATDGQQTSAAIQITNGMRRWFLFYYDPSTDRDLGDLKLE